MYPSLPPIPHRLSTISTGQRVPGFESQYSSKIHILDDDSLLHIFYLCRLVLSDEDRANEYYLFGREEWNYERWWYKLVHVCRRWRFLILSSASHLGLSLLCNRHTPVADMLAHSPPLPLVVHYFRRRYWLLADEVDVNEDEDKHELLLALQHRNRVRGIRLCGPAQGLQKFINALDSDFPMLEHLYISPSVRRNTALILPRTFQASYLRHLILHKFAFPILPTATAAALVTLSLKDILPYLSPNDMVQQLSLMLHLETLSIAFPTRIPIANPDVMEQLLPTPITTHAALPNLRRFQFTGTCAYLEELLPQITTLHLEELSITFFDQPTISPPHLLQFIMRTEDLRFGKAMISFSDLGVQISASPQVGARVYNFDVKVLDQQFDRQMAKAAQISNVLSTILSEVVDLTLSVDSSGLRTSPEWHPEDDEASDDVLPLWCELLRPFRKVRTLVVEDDFSWDLSRCLQSADEESPMELLPELEKLDLPNYWHSARLFASFLSGRQHAGYPVVLWSERSLMPMASPMSSANG
ncbi:hypothetical protein BC827DRAFT_1219516 [Russula dissimulans]|nr:hypothetical protein BC827DRAFT_1219516 [Russula dissimulans]